jgi:hypothetical protein
MQRPFPHSAKDREVEEMHSAEHQQNSADLGAQGLDGLLRISGDGAVFQSQCDIADIDEIETHDQEMIDGISEALVSKKTIHEENATVFMQRASDPDGEANADGEVSNVGDDEPVHIVPFAISVVSVVTELE